MRQDWNQKNALIYTGLGVGFGLLVGVVGGRTLIPTPLGVAEWSAIGTMLVALITPVLLVATRIQIREAREAAEDAQRPWVDIWDIDAFGSSATVEIKNYGNSPALDVRLEFAWRRLGRPGEDCSAGEGHDIPSSPLLICLAEPTEGRFSLAPDDVEALNDHWGGRFRRLTRFSHRRSGWIHVFGRIEYDDVFGKEHVRAFSLVAPEMPYGRTKPGRRERLRQGRQHFRAWPEGSNWVS